MTKIEEGSHAKPKTLRRFGAGDTLYRPEQRLNCIYRLVSGVVEQSSLQPGFSDPVILRWIGSEGDSADPEKPSIRSFIGVEGMASNTPQTSVRCLTEVMVEQWTYEEYRRTELKSVDPSKIEEELLIEKTRLVEQQYLSKALIRRLAFAQTFSEKEARVADLLIQMASWTNPSPKDNVVLLGENASKLAFQTLAKAAGIDERSWREYINKFHNAGIIYKGDRILITDFWRLRLIARAEFGSDDWTAKGIGKAIRAALDAGHAFIARNMALQALEQLPKDAEIAYLACLASARAGSLIEARRLSKEFRSNDSLFPDNMAGLEAALKAEWDSLDARLLKDHAFEKGIDEAERRQRLRAAFEGYTSVFREHQTYFAGINAAALAVCVNERTKADLILREIRTSDGINERNYWALSTRGEMELLNGNTPGAVCYFQNANAACEHPGQKGSTRRQLQRISAFVDRTKVDQCLAQLRQPVPIVFSGHMPAADADHSKVLGESGKDNPYSQVRQEIEQTIAQYGQAYAYGALAAGADLMVAESIIKAKQELHVVLPMDFETFKGHSVSKKGMAPGWRNSFSECLKHARTVRIFQDCRKLSKDNHLADQAVAESLFHGGFRFAAGLALLHADELAAAGARMLSIRADGPRTSLAGTGEAERVAREFGMAVDHVPCYWRKPSQTGLIAKSRLRPVIFFFPINAQRHNQNTIQSAISTELNVEVQDFSGKDDKTMCFALCCTSISDALCILQKSSKLRHQHHLAAQCAFGLAVCADGKPSKNFVLALWSGQGLPFSAPKTDAKRSREAGLGVDCALTSMVFATEPFAAEARLVLRDPDILQPLGRFNNRGYQTNLVAQPSLRAFAVTDYALTTDWRTKL